MKPRPSLRSLPVAVLAALVVMGIGTSVAAGGRNARSAPADAARPSEYPFVDARASAPPVGANTAQAALAKSLGVQGVVDVDPLTLTPSVVAKLDGFLTGPAQKDAKAVVLDYVRGHPGVFRLDADDLAGLRLVRDYTDIGGTRHLTWAQVSRGIPAFGNDLRASVTSDGRLVNVLGSPVPDLEAPAPTARLGADDAVGATLRSVGRPARALTVRSIARGAQRTTRFAGGHEAQLALVYDGLGTRLAWRVTARAGAGEIYNAAIDAASGRLLYRANKVEPVNARVWDYYPGAALGGAQRDQDITGWLDPGATTLTGPNAHVFADLADSPKNSAILGPSDREIGPSDGTNWNHPFTAYTHVAGFCAPSGGSTCSWNSYQSGGWDLDSNLEQNATQAFYFVNNFHDHLEAPPIGFDAAAGAFDSSSDPVIAQTDDGARGPTDFLGLANMPDSEHVTNANMFTRPDGSSPEMQMYLFTSFTGPSPPSGPVDPTPDVNGGDDASVVYHEYTHGLSSRLLTYSDGWGALDAHQSGSMGEGWSDWYAMDYLVEQIFAPDDPDAQGEVQIGSYVDGGNRLLRTEGLDCLRGPATADCPGSPTAGGGGYTFGDLGKVWPQGAEVHADGEIWGQTLWQLRRAMIAADPVSGVADTRTLVTRAMELSPTNPSFLQMRNAILQADKVNFADMHKSIIWSVFANRGMGFLAWTGGANKVSTVQDFSLPRSFTCLGRTATRVGTNGSETITGTNGADVIVGNGGNDTINGRGGNDRICGGFGADTLTGGGGVDMFDAGPANDTLQTKDGVRERTIKGGTGRDRAHKDRTDRTNSVERFF